MLASKHATRILCALAAAAAIGCSGDVVDPRSGGTHTQWSPERLTSGQVDKIDLLLMIDNSRSMADKQQILALAVPDLVRGLVSPRCLDDNGAPSPTQPAGPLESCPPGTHRELTPVLDIHIGLITSSLGGHGSDACPAAEVQTCSGGATNTSNADMAHLVSRTDPCHGGPFPTYEGKGFLAWDPVQTLSPPGEPQLGDLNGNPGLVPTIRDLLVGAGQVGCGYESQLESWYRFLVDPDPYGRLEIDDEGNATPDGHDLVLIQQRMDFLRSSSVLAVVMLTDEDDCSIKDYGRFYFAAQQRDPGNPGKNFYLPKPRSECAKDPDDPCCKSCAEPQGECPPDPACDGKMLDALSDDVNLRCWDQKRRFGIDFLYPIDRYANALTGAQVPNRTGELVPNPIFSHLNKNDPDTRIRTPAQVFLSAIVGVPWQDIARDPKDLKKGFKNASELLARDSAGHTTWDYVIGDPAKHVPPLDPHMIASTDSRSGTNPITGTPLAPPSAPNGADPINGHEWSVGMKSGYLTAKDDLQYACIFDLPEPRDCSPQANNISCDCTDPKTDNPLCEPNPNDKYDPTARTLQVRAKAYPGIRQLATLKALGSQGVVASVCPAQMNDPSQLDFGYRPAVSAILEGLRSALGAQCLSHHIDADESGRVACALVEARSANGACTCDGAEGRASVSADHQSILDVMKADEGVKVAGYDCFVTPPRTA